MPIRLATRKNNVSQLERAIRLRTLDYENEKPSKKEQDARANTFLRRSDYHYKPNLVVNQPLSSNQFREFLRDTRFFIALNNMELNDLEKGINNLVRSSLNIIDRIQKDVNALDSVTREEEIKIYKNFDDVHHNAFTRERDMPIAASDHRWMIDYKSEISYDSSNLLTIIPSAGATLPVLDRIDVPVVNVELVGEETDVGDTKQPIISTDPRYVFLPNKVFRHVIIRKEHDEQGHKFNRTNSYCTFLVELPGVQLVNVFKLVPASMSSLIIDRLSYINESGEEVALNSLELQTDTGITLLFEPIRARYMKLKLVQYAPVTKLGRNHNDIHIEEINKILAGLTWAHRLDSHQEYIEGRVFDFSVKDIKVALQQYESTGIFRSKDVRVRSLASATVTDILEDVPLSAINSGRTSAVSTGEALTECYLGVDINRNNRRALRDLIPLPDTFPVQKEYLVLLGNEAKVKLLPDFLWNLSVNRVTAAVSIGTPLVEITTSSPHGYEIDDLIGVIGPATHELVGRYKVRTVVSDTKFTVRNIASPSLLEVTANTTPYLYVYTDDEEVNNVSDPPIRVYRDDTELFIGADFKINFSVGQNWLSQFPKHRQLNNLLEDPRSGRLRIQFSNPSFDAVYRVEYKPMSNQFLGKTKLVQLKNGKVVFDKSLRRSSGIVNTIVLLRGGFSNPYLTSVLRSYSLKMRNYR